jgi:hypothetical protein
MRYRDVWSSTLIVALVLAAAFTLGQCVWERF